MPLVLFFAYFFLETLTFWAVSQWIGVGWALVALFATMFFGMSLAMFEVRRMMSSKVVKADDGALYMQDSTPGKTAGNVGLTIAGGVLLSLPGFLSTVLGALLIFPPTRALFRTMATISIFRSVERLGVRMYEHSPMSQHHANYGSFNAPQGDADSTQEDAYRAQQSRWPSQPDRDPLVIDEDEIRRWSESLDPKDFGDGGSSGNKDASGE